MKKIVCIIQQHMFANSEIREIEKGFRAIYKKNYSEEDLKVLWMIIPKGFAYSERKPSNATVILVEVNDDIKKEKREELMGLFSQFLLNDYKVSPLDSIITVANSSWIDRFMEAQENRIQPMYRPWIKFKTMFTALTSKWTNGFLRMRVRY